jgi:hypothetical protein
MAFIEATKQGTVYAPGWFLAHEECVRKTREINALDERVKTANGGKYMPMGTIYPANDGTAEGIVYEDVDVTAGNMPGSVVLSGVVYEERLPETVAEAAKTALEGKGFVFETEPTVTRPE